MKKSLKKAKGKASKKENLEKLNNEEVKDVSGGTGSKKTTLSMPNR